MQKLHMFRPRSTLAVAAASAIAALAMSATATATAPVHALHWSGHGKRSLGTIKLTSDVVVHWTDTRGSFSIRDRLRKLAGPSSTKVGETFLAAGTYHYVVVVATGSWTLSITPLPAPTG